MRHLPLIPLLCAACVFAPAQQVGQNKAAGSGQGPTFSVESRLVVEAVVVKDKQGHYIPGLTAKDFVVTEDGVAQQVSFCEHEDLTSDAKVLPVSKPANEDTHIYNRLARSQIAPETSGFEKSTKIAGSSRCISTWWACTRLTSPARSARPSSLSARS